MSMRRDDVASTSVRRHFDVICLWVARLIWVFAECICHFVDFVVLRLVFNFLSNIILLILDNVLKCQQHMQQRFVLRRPMGIKWPNLYRFKSSSTMFKTNSCNQWYYKFNGLEKRAWNKMVCPQILFHSGSLLQEKTESCPLHDMRYNISKYC